ncbi:MAG: PaaI family thioesterase [Verrucomicrobiota bacterium]|nr:PaaI family thioesterase [Verrucomicrobiota bacterium]
MRFQTDGKIVEGRLIPGMEHVGFVGVTHGGLLATVLDEIMVWACSVPMKKFFFSAEMTVRYFAPARPGEEILARGEMIENRRNRIFIAQGELKRITGEKLASATGKYMPIPESSFAQFATDFEGTAEQLRRFIMPG